MQTSSTANRTSNITTSGAPKRSDWSERLFMGAVQAEFGSRMLKFSAPRPREIGAAFRTFRRLREFGSDDHGRRLHPYFPTEQPSATVSLVIDAENAPSD